MKTRFHPILFPLVWALSAAAGVAGPAPKSQIPAGAKWVLHLDMERFAPSQTCRSLLAQKDGNGQSFQGLLARYRALLGVDPLRDLSGVTAFGEHVTGNRGVALLSGALNPKAVATRLSGYPSYRTRSTGKLTVHSWLDKNSGSTLFACFYTTRLLLMASDEAGLAGATAVLDGSKSSLADDSSLPFPAPRPGAFLTAVTRGYAGANPDPIKALILRGTDTATLQLAENRGLVDGALALTAISPDTAFQIHQILNGLIVSASFSDTASPLAKLAEMSEVKRQDRNVTLSLRCPAQEAAGVLAATLLAP
jgi:hypothetical protein